MTDHTKQALLDLKAHQQSGSYRLCPRCGKDTMKANLITNALSRHTDLYICDACGMQEAILDYTHAPLPIEAWAALLQKRSAKCNNGSHAGCFFRMETKRPPSIGERQAWCLLGYLLLICFLRCQLRSSAGMSTFSMSSSKPSFMYGLPEIVEEEAEIIRAIYKRFLEGDTICMIAKKLNEKGIPSPAEKKKLTAACDEQEKKTKWCAGTVESILTNEKYKGDALLQKTYCTDFLTKKMKVNEGEVPQYYVQDSHPAIVDEELFDLVQMELARRRALKGQYSGNGCFASRVVCGDCGHFYGSKVWHSNDQYRKVIWRCNHKYNGQQKCTSPHISQETLECAFEEVMRRMIAQREHVIAACRLAVKEVLDADDLRIEQEDLEEKLLLLNERIRRLVNDNARTEMDQEAYCQEYDMLSAQYKQEMDRIQEIDEELRSREVRKKQIALFLRMFERQEADVEFDGGAFVAMVERVNVGGTKTGRRIELKFVLKNYEEAQIEI